MSRDDWPGVKEKWQMNAEEQEHALDHDLFEELKKGFDSINSDASSDNVTTWITAIIAVIFAFGASEAGATQLLVFPVLLMLLRVCSLITRHTKITASFGMQNLIQLIQLHKDRLTRS